MDKNSLWFFAAIPHVKSLYKSQDHNIYFSVLKRYVNYGVKTPLKLNKTLLYQQKIAYEMCCEFVC